MEDYISSGFDIKSQLSPNSAPAAGETIPNKGSLFNIVNERTAQDTLVLVDNEHEKRPHSDMNDYIGVEIPPAFPLKVEPPSPSNSCISQVSPGANSSQPLDLSDDSSKRIGKASGDNETVEPNSQKSHVEKKEKGFSNDASARWGNAGSEDGHVELCDANKSDPEFKHSPLADGNGCGYVKEVIPLISGDVQLIEIPVESVISECEMDSSGVKQKGNPMPTDRNHSNDSANSKEVGNSLVNGDERNQDYRGKILNGKREERDGKSIGSAIEEPLVKRRRGRPRKVKNDMISRSSPPPLKESRPVRKIALRKPKSTNAKDSLSHTCIGCGDWFQRQAQLIKHELVCEFLAKQGPALTDNRYTCPLCSEDCTRRLGLKRHLISMHPASDSFSCRICLRVVGPVHNYVQHFHGHLKSGVYPSTMPFRVQQHSQNQSNKIKTADSSVPHPAPNFHCFQCNRSVENDHSLAVHLLWHQVNRSPEVSQDCVTDLTSLSACLNSLKDFKTFKESQEQTSLSLESFPSVSPDLVSTIDNSFDYFRFTVDKLNSELQWNSTSTPNCRTNLIKKLNTLSMMSLGVSELSRCLSKLLEKGGKLNENPLSKKCNLGENLMDKINEEVTENRNGEIYLEDNESESRMSNGPKHAISSTDEVVLTRPRKKTSKKIYQCNVCSRVLSSNRTLRRHEMIHKNSKPHKCQLCFKSFRRCYQLTAHYDMHIVAGEFKCYVCEYSVNEVDILLKHLAEEHKKVEEECSESATPLKKENGSCHKEEIPVDSSPNQENDVVMEVDKDEDDKDFEEADDCDDDQEWTPTIITSKKKQVSIEDKAENESESAEGSFMCGECGIQLAHRSSYTRHQMIHENRKPFKCQVCCKGFRRKHQLTKHSRVHIPRGNKYKCDLCDFFTNTRTVLEKHESEHDPTRQYCCETCGVRKKTPFELKLHQKTHQPRSCKHCEYSAKNYSDLRIHERKTHLTFTCSECSYACFSNWQLQRHRKTHSKEPDELFFCELCGFSCKRKRQFSYHMIRHSDRTPFSCSQCDYKCSSRSSLAAHKLMHAGLKPFLCSFCGMSFRRSSHLNNHLLIHKDEKRFVCRTCSHPFRTRHNLKVHEMIHTGEKHHRCHLCPFACRRNKELRLHLEKHASNDNDDSGENETTFVPKAELKIEGNALPQEVFAAMFQVQ